MSEEKKKKQEAAGPEMPAESEGAREEQPKAGDQSEPKAAVQDEAVSGAEDPSRDEAPDAEERTEGQADAEAEETAADSDNERYMRLMAEFQNYKKRVAKEKSDIHAYANEQLIVELLTVLDNFERALDSDAAADEAGYAEGMRLIFTQLRDVLTKAGLEEMAALGETFDPLCHNAVMTEEAEDYESNHVCRVLQKGYRLKDKVVRPAMVAVAK